MHLTHLEVRGLRRLEQVELAPGPGFNLLIGGNGTGKTSLLEAIHLLAYGRSFRGRVRDGLVRSGLPAVEVVAQWHEAAAPERKRRVGLRHSGQAWEGRLDGQAVAQLGDLCAALAVVSFEPGSHALVSGGGDPRRRYLDWGLFHVEQAFYPLWRRYARALKQRNSVLKQHAGRGQLDAWDQELEAAGTPLTRLRQDYLDAVTPHLQVISQALVPGLGAAALHFHPGWRAEDLSLSDALLLARDRDLASGFTSVGPHRADWRIRHAAHPNDEALSRGQAKLTALACVLAQAAHYAQARGEWPIVLLDDLASELDRTHQAALIDRLAQQQAQVFITGTEAFAPRPALEGAVVFHVERGEIRPSA